MPLWLRMSLFILAVLVLVVLTSAYVFRRGARVLGLRRRGRIVLGAILVASPAALVASPFAERSDHPGLAAALGTAGATVILGVLISTALIAAVDLPLLALAGLRRLARAVRPPAAPTPAPAPAAQKLVEHESVGHVVGPASVGRRELIRRTATGAALSIGFGSAFYGTLFGRRDYEIVEVPISIAGLSPRLDGYRIAQISDVHFGLYVGEPELRRAVALVRSARPDLIVLTGDLVDHDEAFAPVLGRLVRGLEGLGARDGVTMIPGNHDYYAGIDAVLGAARDGGASVLRNAGRVVGDGGGAFALLGVDDVWGPRNGYGVGADLGRAIAMVPADLPRVLLCHNPELFPRVQGQVALQLSGHTHGGQVNLGIRPAELLLPYVAGLYEEGGSRLYVNRGFGTAGPPARLGAAPEVTLIVLAAA